jgi:hypothetical protein
MARFNLSVPEEKGTISVQPNRAVPKIFRSLGAGISATAIGVS